MAIAPVLDEEEKIREVVRRTPRPLVDEILVVDDGSTDRSAAVAREEGARVHSMGRIAGVGAAIRAGYGLALAGGFDVAVDGAPFEVRTRWRLGELLFRATIGGTALCVQIERLNVGYRLTHTGSRLDALVVDPWAARLAVHMPVKAPPDTSKFLLSPMPGLLVSVAVAVGQETKVGEELAVIEAMKMENVLRAERDGVIATVHAEPGDSLTVDQAILEFE